MEQRSIVSVLKTFPFKKELQVLHTSYKALLIYKPELYDTLFVLFITLFRLWHYCIQNTGNF